MIDGLCKLRLIDGTVYIGKWLDGLRHGHGMIDWPNKDSYQVCILYIKGSYQVYFYI
jgi:hypothetical protein